MGRLVEYILLLLSVVLVVSTLTGSTNNYYNAVTRKFVIFTNASLTPNPVTRGKAYYLKGTLHIRETIQWGILHNKMAYNFKNYTNITFIDDKFNLCDFFVDLTNSHCPITPGTYQINYTRNVPKLFWPGRYYAKATAYNKKGEEMMYQKTEVTIN
uniref:MD-2-related lipid-recognition domain-containing protein n=1 Tax=Amphimedon queenslandica TaxID=400682 RepID=A0A1X7TJL3_AMPQE